MNRSARARSSAVSLAAAALVVAVGCAPAAAPPSPSTNRTIAAPASVASVAPSPSKAPAASAQASPAGPQVTSMPSAPDSGVVVKLTSSLIHWSESQISAPAAKAWHVEITVKDGASHNFRIVNQPDKRVLFATPNIIGAAAQAYDVPGLPAGTYTFLCSVHPTTMTGTLTLQ